MKGKVCQAVADLNLNLNLNAEVLSHHDPKRHDSGIDCDGCSKFVLMALLFLQEVIVLFET